MTEIALDTLEGTNPLGFFAALGGLDIAHRQATERAPTLRWTDDLIPRARLAGLDSVDELVSMATVDLERWRRSPVLYGGPDGQPLSDLKPKPAAHHEWAMQVADGATPSERADADLLTALLAEGAAAGTGDAKPTHFHFTAGRQLFLVMVRELLEGVTSADFEEALHGPWRYESTLPVLGWDSRGERIFALRGFDPATEKRTGVPGVDWLAFLGLTFFPVAATRGRLQTAGCSDEWRGSFTWPLWTAAVTAPVVRSLLTDPNLGSLDETQLSLRGISRLLKSQIRRSGQGGYGSFGAAIASIPKRSSQDAVVG